MSEKRFFLSGVLIAAAAVVPLVGLSGCNSSGSDDDSTGALAEAQYRTPLLTNAMYALNNLEQFDEGPALDQVVERLNQWSRSQTAAVDWKADPLIDTLPKNLRQADWRERLDDKTFDRDVDGEFLKEATWLRDISNAARKDKLGEVEIAQELFDWTIRNIQLIPDPKADTPQAIMVRRRLPADVLLLGEGTAVQRAWVFILLARQQKLDVVMLATADEDHADQLRPWAPALLHEGQLYLFDTRLGLALPGPGGKGIATLEQATSDEAVLNQLNLDDKSHYPILAGDIKSVTALVEASPGYLSKRMKVLQSQLTGNERVILTAGPSDIAERLKNVVGLSGGAKLWTLPFQTLQYRQQEEQLENQRLKKLVQLEIGRQLSPFKLPMYYGPKFVDPEPGSRQRALDELMAEGETRSGQTSFGQNLRRLRMEHSVSEDELGAKLGWSADKVSALESSGQAPDQATVRKIADALGAKPEDLLARNAATPRPTRVIFPLWAGRLLQFRNRYDGDRGAKKYYISSRPGEDELPLVVGELVNNFQKANRADPSPALVQTYQLAALRRKQDATLWLGLMSFDEGQYSTAIDYLDKQTLKAYPDGPWTTAATYNLGRAYEASGAVDDAIKVYEADQSPQRYGNRLRARQLKAAQEPK